MANEEHVPFVPGTGHNATHIALLQHTARDGAYHALRIESRCNCAHNAAHALAKLAAHGGAKSTVQCWRGGAPLAVVTTTYPEETWEDLAF